MSNIKQVIKYIYSLYPEAPEERGRIFEHYCKWFLENDPSYSMKLKKVWLWKDWPDNWGRDKGIDLIAETHSGEIWAIQAKFYDEIYYVTKEDMDRFLSESSRKIISYRLLISTTSLIGANALEVINGQEKQVGVCTLNDLEEINLEWPLSIDSLNNKTVKKSKNPEPHQIDAIKNILDGFEKSNLGQVHMACGTGKTLVGLWVNQELKCQKTLVLVPSISLVSQLYNSWAENSNFKFDSIFICSDDTVSSNDEDEQIVSQKSEFGFPVTTSAQELINQLSYGDRPKIVFATYHSSPVIKEACKLDSNLIFDLSIADEAHRCSGPAKSDFATIIDKPAIRTKRKLFMTATPKIFSENVKQKTKELDYEIASMDDVTKFGPVFHKLSFSQAIQQDLLSDYQVLISVMDDITYREYAEKGRFVVVDDHETDARTLASQILVAKTIKKLNLKKVITFHNRTNAAKDFIKTFKKAANMLSVEDKPEISFTDSIFGDMQQSARRNIIKSFKEATNENAGILANVKCLSEGVDLPELDGIAFIDPKRSVIDIVQAVGRVIRKPRDKKIKKIGTIIIPVFVDTNSDGVMDLEESCFKVVWQVVNALRAHDDALAEELDNIRLELGKRTYKNPPKLSKIIFDAPTSISANFGNSLRFKIVETCSKLSLAQSHPEVAAQWHLTKNDSLTANDFTAGSHKKIWWQCSKFGDHHWQASIATIIRSFETNTITKGCPFCQGSKVINSNCLAIVHPEIAESWHPEFNKLTPFEVTRSSNKKAFWKCLVYEDHIWKASINNRVNQGCPYCSGKKASKNYNLTIKFPNLVLEWNQNKNGNLLPENFTPGSNKYAWWSCEKNHEYRTKICHRVSGSSCPFCFGKNISKERSLAYKRPDLSMEFHLTKNGNLTSELVHASSSKKVWWSCSKNTTHEWQATVDNRNKGTGCPDCHKSKLFINI